jgi:hypothetical protein
MAEYPSMGYKCCVSNTGIVFNNVALADIGTGGLDERVSWVIAVNTGIDITSGGASDVGFAIDILSNAVLMADYKSPVAVDALKEPKHTETSKDREFTEITDPDKWNAPYLPIKRSSKSPSTITPSH